MVPHIEYILLNLPSLFRFYNFQSASFRFYDYQGRQRSNHEMANFFLNGGENYSKSKRKKTNRNKRKKRRKAKGRRNQESQVQPSTSVYHPKEKVHRKSNFTSSAKVPLVVFGYGLMNKENVPMKGQLSGTSGVLLDILYQRSKQLTAGVVMTNEYNTSKVRKKKRNLLTADSHKLNRFVQSARQKKL
jgi:nitrous oxide reductase